MRNEFLGFPKLNISLEISSFIKPFVLAQLRRRKQMQSHRTHHLSATSIPSLSVSSKKPKSASHTNLSSVWNAIALQDHFSKSLNLSSPNLKSVHSFSRLCGCNQCRRSVTLPPIHARAGEKVVGSRHVSTRYLSTEGHHQSEYSHERGRGNQNGGFKSIKFRRRQDRREKSHCSIQKSVTTSSPSINASTSIQSPTTSLTTTNTFPSPMSLPPDVLLSPISTPTFAQKLGLIPSPPPPPSRSEWIALKQKVIKRGELKGYCVICQDGFLRIGKRDILTSCGHLFHEFCLKSYERFVFGSSSSATTTPFHSYPYSQAQPTSSNPITTTFTTTHQSTSASKSKSCPICRTKSYFSLLTSLGHEHYLIQCVVKIQATYLMYKSRKKYLSYRRSNPPLNPVLRSKWFQEKLDKQVNVMGKEVTRRNKDVEGLLKMVDDEIERSRRLKDKMIGTGDLGVGEMEDMDELISRAERDDDDDGDDDLNRFLSSLAVDDDDEALTETQVAEKADEQINWEEIFQKSIDRKFCRNNCPICIMPILPTLPPKPSPPSVNRKPKLKTKSRPGTKADPTARTERQPRITNKKEIALLSCTHVFHEPCIASFERFCDNSSSFTSESQTELNAHYEARAKLAMATHSCPVCRTMYTKKVLEYDFVESIVECHRETQRAKSSFDTSRKETMI
ncbi:hypothetical protein BKA69DRAFT_639672 [Paraphysoderma sedebokerense]|nr:hypothetical protein BKA69DRAFT_639672 [Paraphysoderma sedebokerense]